MPPLVCPSCSDTLSLDRSSCPSCDQVLSRPYGIFSFTNDIESTEDKDERETIERIAELTETGSIRAATNEVLVGRADAEQLLREIYDVRCDAWRMLVDDQIGGRCLDLYTGWGRRSLALAELAESVYAVDSDLAKLRVLNARDDFESVGKVVPIHTEDETLPFGENTFDTLVADFTDRSERVTEDRIELFDSMVRNDGSILLLVDGIPRKLGISGMVGLDGSTVSVSFDSIRSTTNHCRLFLENLGYEEVRFFVLWPTLEMLSIVYEMHNSWGHQHVVQDAVKDEGTYSKLVRLMNVADRLNLLEHCFPNVLVVGSRTACGRDRSRFRPVLLSGRSRAVSFEYRDELRCVQKIPIRKRHSQYNEREHALIQELRTSEPQIGEDLPHGDLVDSRFGSIRKERPIDGRSLSESIGESPDSREEPLTMGLNWLLKLQQPRQRKRVTFSPGEYVERSELDRRVFNPARLPNPVHAFETPIHGDYLPGNIYVDDGEVTTVIDWEYGSHRGNPIIDAGFFVARMIGHGRVSGPEAIRELWRGENRYAAVGRRAFQQYCEACDIDITAALPLIPLVYLHRVGVDTAIDATNRYTGHQRKRLARAERLWSSPDF